MMLFICIADCRGVSDVFKSGRETAVSRFVNKNRCSLGSLELVSLVGSIIAMLVGLLMFANPLYSAVAPKVLLAGAIALGATLLTEAIVVLSHKALQVYNRSSHP